MAEREEASAWVELPDAIEALRTALEKAWLAGIGRRVRFRLEPVELTVQAAVTRTGKGSAGLRWHVLSMGADRSHENVATQTLKLGLAPVVLEPGGSALAEEDQMVSDLDDTETS